MVRIVHTSMLKCVCLHMFVPNLSLHGIHTVSLLDQINYQMPKLDHKVTPLI